MEHLGLAMLVKPELAQHLVRDCRYQSSPVTFRGSGPRGLRRLVIRRQRRAVAIVSGDIVAR